MLEKGFISKTMFRPFPAHFCLSARFMSGLAGLAIGWMGFAATPPLLCAEQAPAVEELPGAKIFHKLCVDCHGKSGEGVPDKYDEPLQGNRSVESLARRISRTMPDDDVGACVGEDAKQVAEYI